MQIIIIKCWIIKLLKTLCFCTSPLEINQWNVHCFTPVMPNALTIWAIRARHLLSHVVEHWLWWYRYFQVKLTFEMLTVCGQQHSFSTHERMFLWKCQSFWDRKCHDLRKTRTLNLRIHAECSNHLSHQGQTFAVPCCWTLALEA